MHPLLPPDVMTARAWNKASLPRGVLRCRLGTSRVAVTQPPAALISVWDWHQEGCWCLLPRPQVPVFAAHRTNESAGPQWPATLMSEWGCY